MKKKVSALALSLALSLGSAGCVDVAAGVGGAATPGTSTTVEAPTQANSADLQFVRAIRPHLCEAIDLADALLTAREVPAEVRDLAEYSKHRQQDELIQLNDMVQKFREHPNNEAGPPTPTDAEPSTAEGVDQAQQLHTLPDDAKARGYLELARKMHVQSIELAESQIANGNSPRLSDLTQQMVAVKTGRIAEIDAMLTRY